MSIFYGLSALALPMLLAGPVLLVIALIDLMRRPEAEWRAAGQDRLVWALIVIFVAFFGPLLYLAIGRPKLSPTGPVDSNRFAGAFDAGR